MTWDLKRFDEWPPIRWLVTLYPRVPLRHKILVGTLINAVLALALYWPLRKAWPIVQPDHPWMILLLFLTWELLLFLSLFLSTYERGLPNPIQQRVRIRGNNPDGTTAEYGAEYISVNMHGPRSGERVDLSSASVYDGLDRLHRSMPPAEGFGLCVGINPTGIVFAGFFADRFKIQQERIGTVITSRKLKGHEGHTRYRRKSLPDRASLVDCYAEDGTFQKKILLVDSEFKTGGNAEYAFTQLISEYGCQHSDIWYVALVVTHTPLELLSLPSQTLESIIRARSGGPRPTLATESFPNRVAYFVPGYVEMPHGIP